MSNERRLFLFAALMFAWILGGQYLLQSIGLMPPAKNAAKDQAVKNELAKKDEPAAAKPGEPAVAKSDEANPAAEVKAEPAKPAIDLVPNTELVLGSLEDRSPSGYHFLVQLDQKGAGVASVVSSRYDADFEARKNPHLPMQLIGRDPRKMQLSGAWPPSLSLTLSPVDAAGRTIPMRPEDRADLAKLNPDAPKTEDMLDAQPWEVVRDDQGRVVRPLSRAAAADKAAAEGQEVVFRTKADNGVVATKTFRLWKGEDGFDFDLKFESPDKERAFSFNLLGPYGIPIEGEWYTSTFREVFFGTAGSGGAVTLDAKTAYDIAKYPDKPFDSTIQPLRFAGIENQYYAILVAPTPPPTGPDDRFDREAQAIVLHRHPQDLQKSDVGVRIASKSIVVGPNVPQSFGFKVFAGPKTEYALQPFGAEELAAYRKGIIPLAPSIARYIITPILSFTYDLTARVSGMFGGTKGNFGVAIILLTLIVKLVMLPLGRKQAIMAQRTQELQPHLKAIQEKYKDDKEKLTKETFALYKKHGVNPVGGCLPALIQLPIFVGLWQALNTSVGLRQAPFLWINDLAAPDMLYLMPFEVPFLGHWFNVLPILVVGLMMFQTKLFAPPATTPEAEMQQKMMKYMMVMMAVMFYKVPSGLGIYFITSSLWSIGERLLLPKIIHEKPAAEDGDAGGDGGGRKGPPAPAAPAKPPGGLAQFWNRILEEAQKDPTYRKMVDDRAAQQPDRKRDRGGEPERPDRDRPDRDRPRARPKRK